MSIWHSTVNRREFMKSVGLAGAGLAAAGATAPIFSDLSEVATSSKANFKQPWFTRELEFEQASAEIDWSIFNAWQSGTGSGRNDYIVGYAPTNEMERQSLIYRKDAEAADRKRRDDGLAAGTPGYQLRDFAYRTGAGSFGPSTSTFGPNVTTPEQRGVPKWTGTHEEATSMIRAAAHAYGCAKIGVMEVTSNTMKLAQPKRVEWRGTSGEAYAEGGKSIVPTSCKWVISYMVGQPTEMTKKGNTQQQSGSSYGYSYGPILQHRLQRFIKSLGYQAISTGSSNLMNVGLGSLTGIGEVSRISMQLTPEYGPMIRYSPGLITDLPLAPTKPIDAGMFKFCATCKLCAKNCNEVNGWSPINMDDEPSWEIAGPSNRAGVKTYSIEWGRCIFCPYCMGSCPYATHPLSTIHETIRVMTGTTSIFNGFFVNMEHFFGYGLHDSPEYCEDWWNRDLNNDKFDVILR